MTDRLTWLLVGVVAWSMAVVLAYFIGRNAGIAKRAKEPPSRTWPKRVAALRMSGWIGAGEDGTFFEASIFACRLRRLIVDGSCADKLEVCALWNAGEPNQIAVPMPATAFTSTNALLPAVPGPANAPFVVIVKNVSSAPVEVKMRLEVEPL